MHANSLAGVPEIFHQLTDPRDPRGVRFPYHALCCLVFLGLLARITEMAVLIRWAKAHWEGSVFDLVAYQVAFCSVLSSFISIVCHLFAL